MIAPAHWGWRLYGPHTTALGRHSWHSWLDCLRPLPPLSFRSCDLPPTRLEDQLQRQCNSPKEKV